MCAELSPQAVSRDAQSETLFNRIAVAKNHYDVLGVGFDANLEEIRTARLAADVLLQPLTLLPQATVIRARLNHSFRVLVDDGSRRDYDRHLCAVDESCFSAPTVESRTTGDAEAQVTRRQTGPLSFTSELNNSVDRRRYKRFGLTMPAYIRGYERDTGWWQELTQTIEVSRSGLSCYIRHGVPLDTVLHLTFAMPSDLRACQFQATDYSIYAIVNRIDVVENGIRARAAVRFIGDRAPSGFGPPTWAADWEDEQAESGEAEELAWS